MELYKISFPECMSSKEYIGISSKGAKARFLEHVRSKKTNPINLAIKKYGHENAVLTVLGSYDDFDSLYAAEQDAIAKHNTKAPNGYNLTDGGRGIFGMAHSEETKRKISESNKGRKLSDSQRKAISDANKGLDHSVQVEAMARSNRGRKRSKEHIQAIINAHTGRKHSPESREKMSISAKGRKATEEAKMNMSAAMRAKHGGKVRSFISPNGIRVDVSDMARFCKEQGLTKTHMYAVSIGKLACHKGWSRV